MVIMVILFIVAVFDIREKKISNCWIQVLWVLGILEMMVFPEIGIPERIFGSCYISFLMLLPSLFGKRAFGGGDIKWMACRSKGHLLDICVQHFCGRTLYWNPDVERKHEGKRRNPICSIYLCGSVACCLATYVGIDYNDT